MNNLSFIKWIVLRENNLSDKPIIMAGNKAIILPSEHGGTIKQPDDNEKQKIEEIAKQHGYWYEGVGENKASGQYEGNWLNNLLGFTPKNNGSYDQHITAYHGIGGAATVFSSLQANLPNFKPLLNNPEFKSCADVLLHVLTNGISMEKPISMQDAQKFIITCENDGLNLSKTPSSQFLNKAKEAEDLMWGGSNSDGSRSDTNLGIFAHQVEKERRKQIYNMAKNIGGVFFLGSDHLPAMAQEI